MSEKMENVLNLALKSGAGRRERSQELNTGYDRAEKSWELIVKYSGSLDALEAMGITVVKLLNNYAVVTAPENLLDAVAALPQIL